jgi:(p)ppGpp synthase/HD superfamily hydrolase
MAGLIWQRAASFAAKAHHHQFRKDGTTPYFSHPARVAITLVHIFECHDDVAITSALLHDTIEDTKTDYDDIAREFGKPVADCVSALTKNMLLPERLREADYDRRLAGAPWQTRLIKLADQYDNYNDAVFLGMKSVRKVATKCRRAIGLAERDQRQHPEVKRAIRAMRDLLRKKRV